MQELEKILEEINYRINEYVDHDYVRVSGDVVKGLSIAKSIVRKHLSRENTTEITRCSRDTQGAEHEINLPKEEFEMLRFSDIVTFRCGNEYISLYMGWDEATREYKNMNDCWIPMEERLPIPNKEIWVTAKRNGNVFTSTDTMTEKGYFWNYEKENILAWKEKELIPEPYRPERSDNNDGE